MISKYHLTPSTEGNSTTNDEVTRYGSIYRRTFQTELPVATAAREPQSPQRKTSEACSFPRLSPNRGIIINQRPSRALSAATASMNRLPSPCFSGKNSNRDISKIYIFCETQSALRTGLVQQTVQIVAALRWHDLTLFVMLLP